MEGGWGIGIKGLGKFCEVVNASGRGSQRGKKRELGLGIQARLGVVRTGAAG